MQKCLIPGMVMVVLMLLCVSTINAQKIYKLPYNSDIIYDWSLNNCHVGTGIEVLDLSTSLNGRIVFDIGFHPDGHIYLLKDQVLAILKGNRAGLKIIPLTKFGIDTEGQNLMSIDEEGWFIITSYKDGKVDYWEIDVYNETGSRLPEEYHQPDNPIYRGFNGILADGKFKVFTWAASNSYFIWDPLKGGMTEDKLMSAKDYLIQGQTMYFPSCGPMQFISRGTHLATNTEFQISIDTEKDTITEFCPKLNSNLVKYPGAHPTDFRQSPLRIYLGTSLSSFLRHRAAGYYDYVKNCVKEAPLVGDDISLATCGDVVDSISFRLRYYDNPRLIDEKIDSEKYPDLLDQTSPSRYVWKNLHGDGVDEIKEYLKSLRYHADWVDRSESERVVMVTMHVGSDSTTSWAVYRLLEEEAYAGDDTTVIYCPGDGPIDLTEYLSDDADLGGRFEQELSSETGIFTPGSDRNDAYLYIVGEGWCADTAAVQVLSSDRPVNSLDTVALCAGVPTKIEGW